MSCQAIDSWTFSELVGAFLDLAIAYFLLCGSSLAYFVSKFLGMFGLALPCPCNGRFGNPSKNTNNNNNKCLQGFLVDCPTKKIANVQFLVKRKWPFNVILADHLDSLLAKESNFENGRVGSEGEASCGSFLKQGRFSVKGKGATTSKRLRLGIRRRRKGGVSNDQSPLVSSFDPLISYDQAVLGSPGSDSKVGNEIMEGSSISVCVGGEGVESLDDGKGDCKESSGVPSEWNDSLSDCKAIENDVSPVEEIKSDLHWTLGFDGNDKYTIRVLEQALEKEHAARLAVYRELEKERSAAATAADEAMAMILRLQEEKASIEMETMQYQRMIEEKSAYDAEEMNILKEILLRREREKHFLEKEVESFRQMDFGNEQLDADMLTAPSQGLWALSSSYSSDDPAMMLQRIGKKEKVKDANDFHENDITSMASQNYTLPLDKKLPNPELDEDADSLQRIHIHRDPNFDKYHHLSRNSDEIIAQGNGMVLMDKNAIDQKREVKILAEHSQFNDSITQVLVPEKTIVSIGEEQEQSDDTVALQGLISKTAEIVDETKIIVSYTDGNVEEYGKDRLNSVLDGDNFVHDVHVIGGKLNMCDEASGNKNENLSNNLALNIPRICDNPTLSRSETEKGMSRSTSDMFSRLPRTRFSRGKALLSDLRRNSMSALDYERLKIDSEVGWLRERLKVVQEGREKLNVSVGHKETQKIELQLLEDIARQLQEIRQLTEPGKAARRVSLPPLSKVMSKKIRWRSVSLGEQRSST
ncbi:hypothetical protein Ddye_019145 [Dipteronia dyeriana]|uniref:GTD-binding domain-containing protein n=1 Tax=Dipteronia dyeriana TaxID=168575 RepID=A0AAD9WVQ7_9ROSI|nr:hypothetical protein Ddye_019145 [Dipteronia dyeriana]